MIDAKGKLFGKISIIDLFLLLLVVAVALGAFVKFFMLEQTAVTVDQAPVRYTLEVNNVRHWAHTNIQVGDNLFSQGTPVGTITGIESIPHTMPISGNGTLWWGEVPDRYTLLIEVQGVATMNDGRFMLSRVVPMGAGNSGISFTSRYAGFTGTVREIAWDE